MVTGVEKLLFPYYCFGVPQVGNSGGGAQKSQGREEEAEGDAGGGEGDDGAAETQVRDRDRQTDK